MQCLTILKISEYDYECTHRSIGVSDISEVLTYRQYTHLFFNYHSLARRLDQVIWQVESFGSHVHKINLFLSSRARCSLNWERIQPRTSCYKANVTLDRQGYHGGIHFLQVQRVKFRNDVYVIAKNVIVFLFLKFLKKIKFVHKNIQWIPQLFFLRCHEFCSHLWQATHNKSVTKAKYKPAVPLSLPPLLLPSPCYFVYSNLASR